MKKKKLMNLEETKNLINEVKKLAEVHSIDVSMIWWKTLCNGKTERG